MAGVDAARHQSVEVPDESVRAIFDKMESLDPERVHWERDSIRASWGPPEPAGPGPQISVWVPATQSWVSASTLAAGTDATGFTATAGGEPTVM